MSPIQHNADPSLMLAAVLEDLDQDAPRLALAEYLKSCNDWRGDLIRVQCELFQMTNDDPFRNNLQFVDHVESLILNENSQYRQRSISLQPAITVSPYRGLYSVLYSDMATLVERGADAVPITEFPFIDRLHLTGDTSAINAFLDHPLLQRLRHLFFSEVLCNDNTVRKLACCANLSRLHSLSFALWGECDDKAYIDSLGGVISCEGAHALATSPYLSKLRELDLTFHKLQAEGTRALCDSQYLGNLQTLNLDLNEITDRGLEAISDGEGMPGLRSLSVANNQISKCGIRRLVKSDRARSLSSLKLDNNALGSAAGHIVSNSTAAESIRHLSMRNCDLGEDGVAGLLTAGRLPRLVSLNVDNNQCGTSLKGLFDSASQVRHLSATSNQITDQAICEFAETRVDCSELTSLVLIDNELTDDGVDAISRNPAFRNLVSLRLSGNPIGDDGAASLRNSKVMNGLRLLSIDRKELSVEERRKLQERFGDGLILA